MPEIRCGFRLHGVVSDNSIGILVIRCNSKLCKPEVPEGQTPPVAEHYFNLEKTSEDGCIYPFDTKFHKQPKI
jgi:hypothetical protein